jgi:hypothetical protein
MSAHTPGPWHWDSDPVKGDQLGRVRYRVAALGKTITQLYYSSYEGGPTNAEADARLIAAAPDLYEALKYAVGNPEFNSFEFDRLARAALAKVQP